jgi:hypothetical protein
MKTTNMKKIMCSAAAVALLTTAVISTAGAETVRTEVRTETQTLEDVNQIPFSMFDVNKDGIFEKEEVGEQLFYVFDRDGNEVIDNIEWDMKSVYTIMPMEKTTYKFVDYDDDGLTDETTYTYETFYKASGLIRFDNNQDGLSPAEFIGVGFLNLDDSGNKMIELEEWKEAYTVSLSPKNAEMERYNN